jgi:hypothetical protein
VSETKPCYQFNHAGLLLGETVADQSPLEPGVFLLPAGCTFTSPPAEVPDGKWPRWNGHVWDLVTKPVPASDNTDPVAKLQAFLAANPDVAAIINDGGANV